MNIVVAFLRHGEFHRRPGVPSAHLPHPLTEEGETQAAAAVDEISDFAAARDLRVADAVDSSNLLRAWQTAQILCRGLSGRTDRTITVDGTDDLAERCLGSAANLTLDEIDAVMQTDPRFEVPPPGWKSSADYRLPLLGAESLMDAGLRVARHVRARVDALVSDGEEGVLKVFVGHGAAFRHAAARMGALEPEAVAGLSMFHCRPVFLAPASDGQWAHVGGEWKVRPAGDVAMD